MCPPLSFFTCLKQSQMIMLLNVKINVQCSWILWQIMTIHLVIFGRANIPSIGIFFSPEVLYFDPSHLFHLFYLFQFLPLSAVLIFVFNYKWNCQFPALTKLSSIAAIIARSPQEWEGGVKISSGNIRVGLILVTSKVSGG